MKANERDGIDADISAAWAIAHEARCKAEALLFLAPFLLARRSPTKAQCAKWAQGLAEAVRPRALAVLDEITAAAADLARAGAKRQARS